MNPAEATVAILISATLIAWFMAFITDAISVWDDLDNGS